MKKIDRKATLKIIAATSVAIFSLAAVFTATSAWFESVRNVDTAGDAFNVKNLSGHLASVSFHKLDSKTTDSNGDATSFTFSSTAVGTITYDWNNDTGEYVPTLEGDTRIKLKQYDPMDRSQPLLLMLHLSQAYETTGPSIRVNGLTAATGFLGARDSSQQPVYSLDDTDIILDSRGSVHLVDGSSTPYTVNYYWLSSVVQFYQTTFANDTLSWTYAMTSEYATEHSVPKLNNSPDKFVTVDNEAETSSFRNAPNLFSSSNGQTIKNIALVIDYYPDAIEFIYSTYLANAILENTYGSIMSFLCDWSLEVI
ncbi:MAG: hypothetical protein K6E59_02625 [Bacilli bacterium]|nr:hypothetical protein [Bacilli bacterium]